jgi:hypothetical protein
VDTNIVFDRRRNRLLFDRRGLIKCLLSSLRLILPSLANKRQELGDLNIRSCDLPCQHFTPRVPKRHLVRGLVTCEAAVPR